MRSNREIYLELVLAEDLEAAVCLLSDDELRQVRGALSRGDYNEWPADRVHGVCIIEGCRRFEHPRFNSQLSTLNEEQDREHGSEVGL